MPGMMMHRQEALSHAELAQMSFLWKYLEDRWSIKKRNDAYILKQANGSKSKMTCTSSYLDACVLSHENLEIKQIQLLTFLHNALDNGWNIKKHFNPSNTCNNYVFVKRHNGQYKMYEDDEFLTQFMKNNLSLES